MLVLKSYLLALNLFLLTAPALLAQLDYNEMSNWAFHPQKPNTFISSYNMDIAVINAQLEIDTVYEHANNSMTNTGVDVFFVHPTLLSDTFTTRRNVEVHEQSTFLVNSSIVGQAGLLARYGRFFAPRYRQATVPTYFTGNDDKQAEIISNTVSDIRAALNHYFDHYNNGNQLILASHSQGSHILSLLFREFFEDNESRRNKLIAVVMGDHSHPFAKPFEYDGGGWKNLPVCSETNQCACIIKWKVHKEGLPIGLRNFSLPAQHQAFVDSGWLIRTIDFDNDWVPHHEIYYDENQVPLRNFIAVGLNKPYSNGAGFVAFDSLYQIRYKRENDVISAFLIEHTPAPDDLRPNELATDEDGPFFNQIGYHNSVYQVYLWPILKYLDQKIDQCIVNHISTPDMREKETLSIYPNPTDGKITLRKNQQVMNGIEVMVLNQKGQIIQTGKTNQDGHFYINTSISGFYLISTVYGTYNIFIHSPN